MLAGKRGGGGEEIEDCAKTSRSPGSASESLCDLGQAIHPLWPQFPYSGHTLPGALIVRYREKIRCRITVSNSHFLSPPPPKAPCRQCGGVGGGRGGEEVLPTGACRPGPGCPRPPRRRCGPGGTSRTGPPAPGQRGGGTRAGCLRGGPRQRPPGLPLSPAASTQCHRALWHR